MTTQVLIENFTNQFINGQWKQGSSNKTIVDRNPFNGEVLLTIPSANKADLDEAYVAAKKAQIAWMDSTTRRKASII